MSEWFDADTAAHGMNSKGGGSAVRSPAILFGSGSTPTSNIGQDGDWFVDRQADTLWGPKQEVMQPYTTEGSGSCGALTGAVTTGVATVIAPVPASGYVAGQDMLMLCVVLRANEYAADSSLQGVWSGWSGGNVIGSDSTAADGKVVSFQAATVDRGPSDGNMTLTFNALPEVTVVHVDVYYLWLRSGRVSDVLWYADNPPEGGEADFSQWEGNPLPAQILTPHGEGHAVIGFVSGATGDLSFARALDMQAVQDSAGTFFWSAKGAPNAPFNVGVVDTVNEDLLVVAGTYIDGPQWPSKHYQMTVAT